MPHSLCKVWIHGIFGTKDRMNLIESKFKSELIGHITEKLLEMKCKVRVIDGTEDHVHCLFLMSNDVTISHVFKDLKGESSHWVNQNDFLKVKFAWQVGYGAFSVSESKVKMVEKYIRNQREHHWKISFQEEYDRFIALHGRI